MFWESYKNSVNAYIELGCSDKAWSTLERAKVIFPDDLDFVMLEDEFSG